MIDFNVNTANLFDLCNSLSFSFSFKRAFINHARLFVQLSIVTDLMSKIILKEVQYEFEKTVEMWKKVNISVS